MVVATPGYFVHHGAPLHPDDLAAHRVILYDNLAKWTFVRGDMTAPVVVNPGLKVSAAEGQRAAVLAGVGLTIASQWLFSAELASGAVACVLDDWSLPPSICGSSFLPDGAFLPGRGRSRISFGPRFPRRWPLDHHPAIA